VLIFNVFGLKIPIHTPYKGFGGFYPINGKQSHRDPKRHLLVQKHITRPTDR